MKNVKYWIYAIAIVLIGSSILGTIAALAYAIFYTIDKHPIILPIYIGISSYPIYVYLRSDK